MKEIETNFNYTNPSEHLPKLVSAYNLISNLENKHWRTIKLKEIKSIISAAAGLYLEARADNASTTPGGTTKLNIEILNRSNSQMLLETIKETTTNTVNRP